MVHRLAAGLLLLTVVCIGSRLCADEPKSDPDFAVQGEYVGELTEGDLTQKIGVQIVALGRGKFRTVGYLKGLPGDGTEQSPKLKWTGEAAGGVTSFRGDRFQAQVDSGSLVIKSGDKVVGKLARVIRRSPTLGPSHRKARSCCSMDRVSNSSKMAG